MLVTVSNALLMSNATGIVRVGGMGWLKPVATMLLMLCSAVLVECLVLNPCCVVMFGMFCVIYIYIYYYIYIYILLYIYLLKCFCNNR